MEKLKSIFVEQQKQYEEKKEKIIRWKEILTRLLEDVEKLYDDFQKEYEASELQEGMPEELRAKLANRREGIRLSVKGTSRLAQKLAPVQGLEEITGMFTDWETVQIKIDRKKEKDQKQEQKLEAEKVIEPEEFVEEELVAEKEEMGEQEGNKETLTIEIFNAQHENEDLLDQMSSLVERMERIFVTFIEKNVAPIVDGLHNGAIYSSELPQEVQQQYPEYSMYVQEWLSIYRALINRIIEFLEDFSIIPVIPELGAWFDENTQEAIGVVEETGMENEQIKEVARLGYMCEMEIYGQHPFLIRPAQVIVVKNGG